jgi:hypothetical protein
MPGN